MGGIVSLALSPGVLRPSWMEMPNIVTCAGRSHSWRRPALRYAFGSHFLFAQKQHAATRCTFHALVTTNRAITVACFQHNEAGERNEAPIRYKRALGISLVLFACEDTIVIGVAVTRGQVVMPTNPAPGYLRCSWNAATSCTCLVGGNSCSGDDQRRD